MKKIMSILAAIFMTISMNSCLTDDNKTHPLQTDGFKMKLIVPSPATRATIIPASALESQVWTLHLLFFESNTGGNGLFVNYYDASPTDGNPLDINEILNIDFAKESGLSKSENYHILVMANIVPYLNKNMGDWLYELRGKTENEVMNITMLTIKGPDDEWDESDNSAVMDQGHLPMSAQVVKNRQEELLEVQLVRIVSRFDVFNHDTDYELISASIWNAYPETYIWDNSINAYAADRLKRYYGLNGANNQIEGGLYGFINYVPLPLQNDEISTCIIVGLDKGDGDGTRYYRANINSPGVFQQLKRNCAYRLNINRVLGKGAPTEKDAYTGQEFLLDIDINGWTVPDQGNIIVDGENILVLPTSMMQFSPEAETRNYNVFCYGEGYLEISQTELPAGFAAQLTINPGSNIHTLTVSVTDNDDPRSGFIELKFGKLKGVITIRQSGHNQDILILSKDVIPSFPSGSAATMEGEVEVTSSGRWSAEIYNGKFLFDNNTDFVAGDNGDTFVIRSEGPATQTSTWYSFLLVTLDSNTEVQRVLVLMQDGSGEIQIVPDWQAISFTANGEPEDDNEFTVNAGGAVWDFNLAGANASKFKLIPDYENNKFVITAERNMNPQTYEAYARIRMTNNPTVYKEIHLSQRSHNISYLPATFSLIPYNGGLSEPITIISSDPWEATVVSGANYATFEGTSQTTISGSSGDTFRVNFGDNSTSPAKRTATIRVSVAGTLVQEDIHIEQAMGRTKSSLMLYTASYAGYGSLHKSLHYVEGFYNSMNTTSKFGTSPTSTVYMPGWNRTIQDVPSGYYMNINADIVCWNDGTHARGGRVRDWLMGIEPVRTDDIKDRVLLFWGDLSTVEMATHFSEYGYVGRTATHTPNNLLHRINSGLTVGNSKILSYLLKDGPFTDGEEVDKSLIGFYGHDATNGSLSDWPDTMIPLIMCPRPGYENHLVLGVDPTTHIIFCGNTEIFHDGTNLPHSPTNQNFDASPTGQANQKFMDNLIAWMVNAALYGKNFTGKFYED